MQQEGNSQQPGLALANSGVQELVCRAQKARDELIAKIRRVKAEVEEKDSNEELTEEIEAEADSHITEFSRQILLIEKKIAILGALAIEDIEGPAAEEKASLAVLEYHPTPEEVAARKDELVQNPDESGWTDATEEMAEADGEQMWLIDDEQLEAMERSSESSESEEEKGNIDIDDLENQFVTGGQSDHQLLFGKHEKFCVSLNGLAESGLLFSGGGDDYLHFYSFPKEEVGPEACIKPYHLVKHTETINKIELSASKEYVFSMTDNEVLCTEIKTLQTKPLRAKTKQQMAQEEGDSICSDMACHGQGDVVAVASGFELEILNIKGLKPYQSYYCEREIVSMGFTDSGKQLYLACDDHRIRLLTPKTGEFSTISGVQQHKSEISAIKCRGDIILSGCIEGYIGISNIKKGSMLALIGSKETEDTTGSINHLEFAGNYFIAGASNDCIDWYDLAKAKKLFTSPLEGSPSAIRWQGKDYEHLHSVSSISGLIYLFDCRNPLKEVGKARAGNTVHELWSQAQHLVAACEDGAVRVFDVRRLL